MVYVDTSVIVKLYFQEEYSREAADWLKENNEAIPLTSLHELEFTNAIHLKRFRSEITMAETRLVMSKFDEHEKKGIFYRPHLDWPGIFDHAIDLAKKHSGTTGSRSLDILHVASALAIRADRLLTLDDRQSEIADRAGLKIENFLK
ncbi:MAG: type II toxin-antitoxin system VapC family toxin [Desulfobacterales bacterium]|nr:MAG: type II toxin-antitoxin system VapC family toxin [Desulfobacterales bacterium]